MIVTKPWNDPHNFEWDIESMGEVIIDDRGVLS